MGESVVGGGSKGEKTWDADWRDVDTSRGVAPTSGPYT